MAALNKSEIFRDLLVIALVTAFMLLFYYFLGGDTIFCADVSGDAIFHVDLQKDKTYQLTVLDLNGPETADVSVCKDSYTPYDITFRLMHPEGDYLPYHPAFSVIETGMYEIVVHPLGPGTIRIVIRQARL